MGDRNMMDLAFANLQKAASHHDIQMRRKRTGIHLERIPHRQYVKKDIPFSILGPCPNLERQHRCPRRNTLDLNLRRAGKVGLQALLAGRTS